MVLLFLWLLPIPAAVQDTGTVTLLEGSLLIIRGTTALQAGEGTLLKQGDIIESSDKGLAQLELFGGAIVALGPSSRMYVLRHGIGGKAGSDIVGAELVLLSGWMKGESDTHAGPYRSAEERAEFSRELTAMVASLVARYHDASAPGGRKHRLVIVAHPLPQTSSSEEPS